MSSNRSIMASLEGGRKAVLLDKPWVVVGRSDDAHLRFPMDRKLSRLHCAFQFTNGGWRIQDLGSKSGTFVNDAPLIGLHQLQSGDRITVGNLVIVYDAESNLNGPVLYLSCTVTLESPVAQTATPWACPSSSLNRKISCLVDRWLEGARHRRWISASLRPPELQES